LATRLSRLFALWLLPITLAAAEPYRWQLPPGFPEPKVPADNPMSEAKVQLGRLLFYDVRLSSTETVSCGSCHQQSRAFTDARGISLGESGDVLPRNSMSLVNLAYRLTFGWADSSMQHLEQQMTRPLFADSPVEMGAALVRQEILTRLDEDDHFRTLFTQAFSSDPAPISWPNIIKAIASFERTLISGRSDYDLWLFQDRRPPDDVVKGMHLFFSEQLKCGGCHGGIGFNNEFYFQGPRPMEVEYHFTGLTGPDLGLGGDAPEHHFLFKAPSLRNIAQTAPYMHDGRFKDLGSVIAHYEQGPAPAEGLTGFQLTVEERQNLILFLHSLTDQFFLSAPRYGAPRYGEPRAGEPQSADPTVKQDRD